MTKKNIILITAFLVLVGSIYFYLYRDLFRKADIQISHTIRAKRGSFRRPNPNPDAAPEDLIIFSMNRDYNLTAISVFSAAEIATNRFAHPLWELTTKSNSAPTSVFAYGAHVRGMHPTVKGAQPAPLQPNVTYRLRIEAGSQKGEHDFSIADDTNVAQ
ncbi:hypothetical protein [Pedosphaera parvula]|uniref:Uncharacterized protein n=1 Tax=Pedosphaera parvula (strain Ellin514) TaxID=320771 RepID=B9XPR3_PEDPL|nr:hypothetical protein [Pedosphaera parvula]EEF58186.1 hypothetical protein Cflav_PD1386 [Pedosphaera parvula Ellin514]